MPFNNFFSDIFVNTISYIHADDKKIPTWTSCRYVLSYVGMVAFTFQYVLRFNLSVAIVCMVKPPRDNNIQLDNSTEYNYTSNYILNNTIGDNDLDQVGDPCGILESSRRGNSETVTPYLQLPLINIRFPT